MCLLMLATEPGRKLETLTNKSLVLYARRPALRLFSAMLPLGPVAKWTSVARRPGHSSCLHRRDCCLLCEHHDTSALIQQSLSVLNVFCMLCTFANQVIPLLFSKLRNICYTVQYCFDCQCHDIASIIKLHFITKY